MIRLVLAALHASEHAAERRGLERHGLAGLFLDELPEPVHLIAQRVLRHHVAAELIAEDEKVARVFPDALHLRVWQGIQLLVLRHGENVQPAVLEAVAGARERLAGLLYLRGELVRRAIR